MAHARLLILALAGLGFVSVGLVGCDLRGGGVLGDLSAADPVVTLNLINASGEDVQISATYTRNQQETRRTVRRLPAMSSPTTQRIVPTAADTIAIAAQSLSGSGKSFQKTLLLGVDFAPHDVLTFIVDRNGPRITGPLLPTNLPPTADAGPDFVLPSGKTGQLDGGRSFDPEGAALTYRWEQVNGPPVVLDDPTLPIPTLTAPPAGPGTSYKVLFRLFVSDGSPLLAVDEVEFTVVGPPVPPPPGALVVGIQYSPPVIAEGGRTLLSAAISGGAGGYAIRWSVSPNAAGVTGFFGNPTAATTPWSAPRGAIGLFTLNAAVRDSLGAQQSASVVVDVRPDCNTNLVPDDADIANGTSADRNGDGRPDECP